MGAAILGADVLGGWTPSEISGLYLWLDAEQGLYQDVGGATPAINDSDLIALWQDQSGNNRHVSQETEDKRPLLKLDIKNGLPVVRFDGSDDFLQATVAADASKTLFIVTRSLSGSGSNRACIGYDDIASFYWNPGDGAGWLWWEPVINCGGTITAWNVLAFKLTSAASFTTYLNGVQVDTDNPADEITTSTTLTLAARTSTTAFGDVDIAEVIIYDSALSDSDRALVDSYLSTKWAIT